MGKVAKKDKTSKVWRIDKEVETGILGGSSPSRKISERTENSWIRLNFALLKRKFGSNAENPYGIRI